MSKQPLRAADPKGRIDVLMHNVAGQIAKRAGAEKVWNGGLGDVVEEILGNAGLSKPITATDVARTLGILPRRRNALR